MEQIMESTKKPFKFQIDIVMVKDPKLGGFTGHLAQFPNIITEGETEEDTIQNIMAAFHDIMIFKKDKKDSEVTEDNIIRRSVSFESSSEMPQAL